MKCSFGVCFLKGCMSDALAQKLEQKDTFDKKRNLAFSVFSGLYLGCGQHVVYNVWFTRVFGTKQNLGVGFRKCMADLFVHVPFLYLPLYYTFEDAVLKGTPSSGIQRLYLSDEPELPSVMMQYAKIFPVVHLVNFTVTPPEFRIGVVACVSFVWLVVLSTISHAN